MTPKIREVPDGRSCLRHVLRVRGLVPRALPGGRVLHRRPERARGEDALRPRRARPGDARPRSTIPSPRSLRRRRTGALHLSAGPRDPARRPVLQDGPGRRSTRSPSPPDREHGAATPRAPPPTQGGTRAGGGHQGPAQHRPHRPDPLPRLRAQPLRLSSSASRSPIVHVMGYFVSVLRERIANFEAPAADRRERAPAAARPAASDRHLDQRPAQEPARPQRAHGQRVPLVAGALRHDARCLADHRHRSAAGSGIGAGRHQHRAQPGVAATSAWRRPPADQKIVQSRRAVEIETLQGAGRGGAAATRWRPSSPSCSSSGAGALWRLPAQRAAGALRQGAARATWR